MADHLEILNRRLNKRLEERRDSLSPQCLSVSKLEAYLTGDLSSDEWDGVKAHLDSCLSCLHAMVEVRDLLRGITDPVPQLPETNVAIQKEIKKSAASRAWLAIRGAFEWKPSAAWGFAGALAGILLTLGVIDVMQIQDDYNQVLQKIEGIKDRPAITLRGESQITQFNELFSELYTSPSVQRVIGVVSTVKEGTEEGIPYHVIRMSGEDGNTYVILSWGPVAVQANDKVLVDVIVEPKRGGTTGKVYSGLAHRISKLEETN